MSALRYGLVSAIRRKLWPAKPRSVVGKTERVFGEVIEGDRRLEAKVYQPRLFFP